MIPAALSASPAGRAWPLHEQPRHFELGHVLSCAVTDLVEPRAIGGLGLHHAGCWECDLSDNSLLWSGGVYDIFGLPRGVPISRERCLSFYCEDSRAKLERLRAFSIRRKCGFTLDIQISAAIGERRWVRLIAAPACDGDGAVRLHGIKLIV